MKAICIRETDEVGPDRSEGGRIKCNQEETSCVLSRRHRFSFAPPPEGKEE